MTLQGENGDLVRDNMLGGEGFNAGDDNVYANDDGDGIGTLK